MSRDTYAARVSAEAVSAIDTLSKRPEFEFFREALRNREKRYAESILNNEALTDDEREDLRQRRLELVDIIEWPEAERRAHVAVMASLGFKPGDGLEVGM